jgi:hypothetical protein
MKRALLCWLICTVFCALTPAVADDNGRHLGSTKLSLSENDSDVIQVDCKEPVHAIKLRAAHGAAKISALWVRYGNSDRERLDIREQLAQGSESRWIDLKGGERCVKEIGIIGESEDTLNKTRIDVFGR